MELKLKINFSDLNSKCILVYKIKNLIMTVPCVFFGKRDVNSLLEPSSDGGVEHPGNIRGS